MQGVGIALLVSLNTSLNTNRHTPHTLNDMQVLETRAVSSSSGSADDVASWKALMAGAVDAGLFWCPRSCLFCHAIRVVSQRGVDYIVRCRLLLCLMPSIHLIDGPFGGKSLFIKRGKRERDNKLKWGELQRERVREREHER